MAIQFQPLSAGSGVVKIERKGTGIQEVPNSGLVEKLVFNTELTTSEVDTIISNANLTFVDYEGMPIYPIFVNEANEIGIVIVNFGTVLGDGTIGYVIMNFASSTIIYSSSTIASLSQIDGWNFDLFEQLGGGNEFPVNMEANSSFQGLPVGAQNNTIKDLINVGGTIPYLKELSGTYEPIDLEISENTTIDLATQYMDNKQMPINLNVNVPIPEYVPNLQTKSVTPSTLRQTITFDDGYDGLKEVAISAVTSAIDSNINYNNIKSGVTILGVSGGYTGDGQDYVNDYMEEIPQWCYFNINEIKSIKFTKMTKINDYSFSSMNKLKTIYFPKTLTYVSEYAFGKAFNKPKTQILTSMYIEDLTSWFNIDFQSFNLLLTGDGKLFINEVETTTLEIPEGITNIKPYACISFIRGIKDLYLPSTLLSIENDNFYVSSYSGGNPTFQNEKKLYINTLEHWFSLNISNNYNYSHPQTPIQNRDLYVNNELTQDIVVPNTYTILKNTWFNQSKIKSVSGDSILEVSEEAFSECKNLTTANFPNATKYGTRAFYSCESLTSITTSNITEIGEYTFNVCTHLVEINLPKVISLPLQSLALCQRLKKLDLGACVSIEKEALGACGELRTLIIRTTSQVCTLAEDALVVTPISDGEGYVYVPDELVASYKADTSWQSALPNYSTQIKPLSEYVEA